MSDKLTFRLLSAKNLLTSLALLALPHVSLAQDICGRPISSFTLPTGRYHIAFMTSGFYNGNLGGRAGADAKCQAEADNSASLSALKPGATWKAYIATSDRRIQDSIVFKADAYSFPSSASATTLTRYLSLSGTSGNIIPATHLTTLDCARPSICNGRSNGGVSYNHGASHYWSGAQDNGAPSASNCSNWTSATVNGEAGSVTEGSDDIYNDGSVSLHYCGYSLPLICVNEEPAVVACNNGIDDDGDSLIDFPRDPGCTSNTDTTETGAAACDNGLDDDGDSLIDFRPGLATADPGCSSITDTSELGTAACDNGLDDDGDLLIDFRPNSATGDPGCSSITDTSELGTAACDNGLDDDSDSLIDGRDPGCQSANGTPNPRDTSELTQCQDTIDNDNDGGIDAMDPGCYDNISDPNSYNPHLDNEASAAFDSNRLASPVYTKFNTFLGQLNFLELITSGTSSLSATVRVYNRRGTEIARRVISLSANSQNDVDINNMLRLACIENPGCSFGDVDVDGSGLVDTYGLVRIDFDDENPNVQLLGRLSNYRQDPGKDSFSFAFARELRNASKNAAVYATANTMDPQARGFLVANWAEVINIEKKQEYSYELFDVGGNRVFATSFTLNPRQEFDVQAGHELVNSAGRPIEGVYLARVTPQGDGAYLFTVARYSANGTSVENSDTYNFAFGVDGRLATGQAQFVFITNQEGAAWEEVNYLELANVTNQRAQATIIYRGRNGEIERDLVSIGPKSQVHINASAILAQHAEASGTAVVVSNVPGSLIAQSLVYYQNKADSMVEAAYFSASKRPTGSLLTGSTNTFMNMSNTIRLASIATASRTVVVNSKGFRINSNGGTQAINDTQNVVVGGNSTQSLLLSNISSIRDNSYGPLTIRNLASGEIIAEVLRIRTQESGQKVDYVMPTLVR